MEPRARGGAVLVLGAAVLWGTTGTAASLAPQQASPLGIGAARVVLGGAVLAALSLVLLRAGPVGAGPAGRAGRFAGALSGRRVRLLVPGALAVAAYQLFFFAGVRHAGVAVGTVVAIGAAPAFTGALAALTRVAALTRRWAVATTVAVAGCAVLVLAEADPAAGASGARVAGILLALGAGLSYAGYAVVSSVLIRAGSPPLGVMGALFGGAALLLSPVLLASGPSWVATPGGVLVAAYLGLVATAFAYLLYGRGLRRVPVSDAATLSLAEPVVAALLGLALLDEPAGVATLAGMALVATSLLLLTIRPGPDGRAATRPTGP